MKVIPVTGSTAGIAAEIFLIILAITIGLPDFDHGVIGRLALAVEDPTLDVNHLAWPGNSVVDNTVEGIIALCRRQTLGEKGPNSLGRCLAWYRFAGHGRFP
jgi:hypothetical protein